MNKQICYKDEIKPSAFELITAIISSALFLLMAYLCLYSLGYNKEIYKSTFLFFVCFVAFLLFAVFPIFWIKSVRKYKIKMAIRNFALKNGEKCKGRVIKTDIRASTRSGYRGKEVIVYHYNAVIEYVNKKGEKVQFTTPELTGNPEFATTKDVTVYYLENKSEYATDFGYEKRAYVPQEKNWSNFS